MNRIPTGALVATLLFGCSGTEDAQTGTTDAQTGTTRVVRQAIDRDRVLELEEELRIDWEGDVEEVGFRLTHTPPGQMVGPFFVQPPFSYPPRWLVDGLGRVHVVPDAEYSIDVFDATAGPLYRVENDYPVEPVTRQDLEEWRESRACAPGQPECDDARTELALQMDIPESKAVVGRLIGFANGHIAVLRTGTDPDPDDNLQMGEYDLFAPDGTFLGRLPLGLSPRWFDGTTLVATEWDEFLVPSMVRYRVVDRTSHRPGGSTR